MHILFCDWKLSQTEVVITRYYTVAHEKMGNEFFDGIEVPLILHIIFEMVRPEVPS